MTPRAFDSPVILVSNRLPVAISLREGAVVVTPSSGGLATALASTYQAHGAQWFGSTGGSSSRTREEQDEIDRALRERGLRAVSLPDDEYRGYYDGFSNGVLWPLFHYLADKVQLDAEPAWDAYRAVNERFARALAEHCPPGALVWVHDYQLMLVPAMLRALRSDVRIGFFLHVPFPGYETFRILPWREELLRGMLGADLLGFHTQSYQHHFAVTAAHILGTDLDHDAVAWEGRVVRLATFAIGIDVARWSAASRSDAIRAAAAEHRARAGGRRIALGVDRLDYTKGLMRRLLAIERFLERHPEARASFQYVQVAVPTRDGIDAYAEYRRSVNELVGRINGAFGRPDWVPIHLLHQSVSFDELAALYLAADVMLVTPLRDGMNLVAKEYCAAQQGGAGALILSEFAGASAELTDAILVNPYDVGSVADALKHALSMPELERAERMQRLSAAVAAQPVERWAQAFLRALAQSPSLPAALETQPSIPLGQPTRWILDYDGTLVPFADRPEFAVADPALLALLESLASVADTRCDVVSGRSREWLDEQLGGLEIGLHAEHGAWSKLLGERAWTDHVREAPTWKPDARRLFAALVGDVIGGQLEEKQASIAWHYRRALPELVAERLGELRARLTGFAESASLDVLEGAKVIELRPRAAQKGAVVRRLIEQAPTMSLVIVGDDLTDEDMFREAPEGALTIKVGPGASAARFRVRDVSAVRALIEAVTRSNVRASLQGASNSRPP